MVQSSLQASQITTCHPIRTSMQVSDIKTRLAVLQQRSAVLLARDLALRNISSAPQQHCARRRQLQSAKAGAVTIRHPATYHRTQQKLAPAAVESGTPATAHLQATLSRARLGID